MNNHKKGFTLIELLIVLALIAILAGVIIVIVKPAEIFKKGRDTKRIGDLRNLSAAIDNYIFELSSNPSGGLSWPTTTNIFFSVATSMISSTYGWPTSSRTFVGSTSTAINGTGWLPLNFASVTSNNLSSLPLDPINSRIGDVTYAYGFIHDNNNIGSYELNAKLEDLTAMTNDGGDDNNCPSVASTTCLYEVGTNKTLY